MAVFAHPGLAIPKLRTRSFDPSLLERRLTRRGGGAFRDRTLTETTYPYVFLDATDGKARVNHRVVPRWW